MTNAKIIATSLRPRAMDTERFSRRNQCALRVAQTPEMATSLGHFDQFESCHLVRHARGSGLRRARSDLWIFVYRRLQQPRENGVDERLRGEGVNSVRGGTEVPPTLHKSLADSARALESSPCAPSEKLWRGRRLGG